MTVEEEGSPHHWSVKNTTRMGIKESDYDSMAAVFCYLKWSTVDAGWVLAGVLFRVIPRAGTGSAFEDYYIM